MARVVLSGQATGQRAASASSYGRGSQILPVSLASSLIYEYRRILFVSHVTSALATSEDWPPVNN